jgi:hypothetical protein
MSVIAFLQAAAAAQVPGRWSGPHSATRERRRVVPRHRREDVADLHALHGWRDVRDLG